MIKIIIGTQTGTAEFVGDELETLLSPHQNVEVTQQPQHEVDDGSDIWIICSSTHGAGEVPDNLKPFYNWLNQQKPDLSNKKTLVLGLGDSNYDTYNQAAKLFEQAFIELNSQQLLPTFLVDAMDDQLPEDLIIEWLTPQLTLFNDKK